MMNFLPLCKAIIQHQRVNKGGYRLGIKNRKADDMCYKRIRFHFLSISVLIFGLTLAGCSKDEILDQYNSVVQIAGNTALTSDFSLKGNRTYGEDCYTGTYTADYKDFLKQNISLAELPLSAKMAKIFLFPLTWKLPREQRKCFGFLVVMIW